jgi:hypothetical protein
VATTISVQSTWYQVLAFDTDGPENVHDADNTSDDITIGSTGVYFVYFSASYQGGNDDDYDVVVKKNNGATTLNITYTSRTLSSTGVLGVVSGGGMVSLSANDTVELWVQNTSAAADITFKDVSLTVFSPGYGGGTINDTAYNVSTWNADTTGTTKNALRDYFYNFDPDGDGDIDESGINAADWALKLSVADIDDTPVDAETAAPISSNWAYDHINAADPHPGYLLDSGTDIIDDAHINWGTAANQVSGADIPLDVTNFDGNLSGSDTTVQAALETLDELSVGGTDAFTVKVDAGATAGYLGAAYNDGVLRTDGTIVTYSDGGDYVTIGLHAYLQDIAGITAAQGDVIYFDGTDWVNLGPGIAGQYLKTGGAAANPSWDDPAGSGDITAVGDSASGAAFTADGTGNVLSFEGTTANTFEIALTGRNPAADVAVYIPAESGDIVLGPQGFGTDNILVKTNGTGNLTQATGISVDDSNNVSGLTSLSIGADPADAGEIRLANAAAIVFEASPAGTDVSALTVTSGEVVQIGASGASGVTVTPAATFSGGIANAGTVSAGTWQGTAIADAYVDNDITLTNITQITSRSLDDVTDGSSYQRVAAADVDASGHVNRFYDSDGTGYATITGLSTARVLTVVDAAQTLANLGSNQTFTGNMTWSGTNTFNGEITMGADLNLNAHEIQSTGNIVIQLGDDAGANKFSIQDSGGVEIWAMNSDGVSSALAQNNPYIVLDENDGTDYYIGIYDTTVDRLEFRRSAAVNTSVDAYLDSNGMYVAGNMDLSTGHTYQINSTPIALTNLSDGLSHASGHERAGTDEIDGDHLDIDFTPSNYTPATTPAEADNVDDLAAHLQGIDTVLGATGTGTLSGLTDTDLSSPASAHILIYDGTNSWDNKAVSGDISLGADGAVALSADSVAPAEMANADHGDFTYASGVASLDADVVAAAEMADADHGDVSWTSGVATVEAIRGITVDNTDIANGKILKYNSSSGNLEYEDDATGSGSLGSNLSSSTNDITTDNSVIQLIGNAEDLDIEFGTNLVTLSTDTGVTEMNFSSFNLVTTGVVLGGVNVSSKTAATYTVGTDDADESRGTLFVNGDNDAIDFTLDTAVSGKSVCFAQGNGVSGAITVQPGTGDYLLKDGTRGTAATDYTSTGAGGDFLCVVAISADDWMITRESGTWSE